MATPLSVPLRVFEAVPRGSNATSYYGRGDRAKVTSGHGGGRCIESSPRLTVISGGPIGSSKGIPLVSGTVAVRCSSSFRAVVGRLVGGVRQYGARCH